MPLDVTRRELLKAQAAALAATAAGIPQDALAQPAPGVGAWVLPERVHLGRQPLPPARPCRAPWQPRAVRRPETL